MTVTLWSAWAIGLVALSLPSGPLMAEEAQKCVFEGTARNRATQLAVPKVTLRLIPNNGAIVYSGSTKADGTFHFENIVPGDYRLEAQRTGFSEQWVLADKSGHAISALRLAAGQVLTGNELWFTPDGTVSGKVLAPDGEPLPLASVTLIERKWKRGKRVYVPAFGANTDDAGVFRVDSVPAGKYWIYAARPNGSPLALSIVDAPGQPEMRIAGRYFPNAALLDDAAAIEVRAGEETGGIDFKLPMVRVFHITGTYPSQGDNIGVGLKARYGDQMLDWGMDGASIGRDGKFDIAGVAPGSYFLYSAASSRDFAIGVKLAVTVTTKDIGGLLAPQVSQFELKGRLRLEGDALAEKIPVVIFCEGSQADAYTRAQCRAEPQPDGWFTIANLTADRYTIRIGNQYTGKDGGFYLKKLRVNGVDVPGHEINLTSGPAQSLELILNSEVGSVEGTAVPPEERPDDHALPEPGELTVVMIPEKAPSGATQPVPAYLDASGQFQVSDLEPGTYRVFAVPAYDRDLWQNADFLSRIAPRGITVDVAEKAIARIEVQALRAADVRLVEERIE